MLTQSGRAIGAVVAAIAFVAAVGCGGSFSPTAPAMLPEAGGSAPSGAQSFAVIEGTVLQGGGLGAEGVGASSLSPSGVAGITVIVVGTNIQVVTDEDGSFRIVNVPDGDVLLQFVGPGINATVTVLEVGNSERVKIKIEVESTTAQLVEEEREDLDEFEGIVDSVDPVNMTFTLVDGTTIATDAFTWWDTGGDFLSFDELADAQDAGQTIEVEGLLMLTDEGLLLAVVVKAESDDEDAGALRLEIKPDEWRTDWATGSNSGSGGNQVEARIKGGPFTDIDPTSVTMQGPDGAIFPVESEFRDDDFRAYFLKVDAIGIVASVLPGSQVIITVRGMLTDGTPFELTDTIEIEEPDDDDDALLVGDFSDQIEEIDDLIDEIDELADDDGDDGGVLSAGLATSLKAKLQAAKASLQKGNVTPAINQLGAFINEVEALVQAGNLPTDDGEDLIEDAQEIIDDLQGS